MLDLVIRGGRIIDGTGTPGFIADVGVKDGKVAAIGKFGDAHQVVDARDRVVCPGFIDPHTHEELGLLVDPVLERYLRQGVTTVINGQCGTSIADTSDKTRQARDRDDNSILQKITETWDSLPEYKKGAEKKGLAFNHGLLLGHGTMRWLVMGKADLRPPTSEEMAAMKAMLEQGMEQGALGMSTGLDYVPSRAATTDEVVELAEVVARYDGTYASHVRKAVAFGRGDGVAEAIQIGRRAGVRVQVSHLTYADRLAVEWMERARQEGVEVACDIMPHSGGHVMRADRFAGSIKNSLFEYYDLGLEEFYRLLKDEKAREFMLENNSQIRLAPDQIILVHSEVPSWEGRSLADVAAMNDKEPAEMWFDLLAERPPRVSFWMYANRRNKTNLDRFPVLKETASSPVVTCGSDSIMPDPSDPYLHYELQRNGVFPRFLEVGRDFGLRLEYDIQRMTALPAQQHRLQDRGVLRPGMAGDILVFSPERFVFPEEINPRDPSVVAQGMEYVMVNGELVIDKGQLTSARPGRVLLKE